MKVPRLCMLAIRHWERLGRSGDITPERLVYEDFVSLSQTKAKWDALREEFMSYLDTLTQDQLDEIVDWELPARELKSENSRWEILFHLVIYPVIHFPCSEIFVV